MAAFVRTSSVPSHPGTVKGGYKQDDEFNGDRMPI